MTSTGSLLVPRVYGFFCQIGDTKLRLKKDASLKRISICEWLPYPVLRWQYVRSAKERRKILRTIQDMKATLPKDDYDAYCELVNACRSRK